MANDKFCFGGRGSKKGDKDVFSSRSKGYSSRSEGANTGNCPAVGQKRANFHTFRLELSRYFEPEGATYGPVP